MWIRNQNKQTLTNCKNVQIIDRNSVNTGILPYSIKFLICEIKAIQYDSSISFLNPALTVIGGYTSYEKALKVMDMIEDAILKCEAMRTGYAEYDFGKFVFDMPADKDVEV